MCAAIAPTLEPRQRDAAKDVAAERERDKCEHGKHGKRRERAPEEADDLGKERHAHAHNVGTTRCAL